MPRLGRKQVGTIPVPVRSQLVLLLAIWCTFAPVGPLMWMVTEYPGNWVLGLVGALTTGLIAAAWASAFIYQRYWTIAIIVPASFFVPRWLFTVVARWGGAAIGPFDGRQERLILLAAMSVVFLVVGYALVIVYTRSQERTATRLKTELDLAEQIHRRLVPPIDTKVGGLEVFGKSEPSSEMGGDLIDMVVGGARVDLCLADVSGHGVRAGVVMGMVKSAIRMRLRSPASVDELLADLDAVLGQTIEPGMFVTFACLRFAESGVVSFGMAGHPPVLRVPRGTGDVSMLENEHVPLGLEIGEAFVSKPVRCEPGDLFVMYTDGLLEVQNGEGKQLGLEGLRALVGASAGKPLAEAHRAIMDGVRRHGAQTDDQTLLLARTT